MSKNKKPDQRNVFLNFPFDRSYEKNYVALIAAVVCVGRKPRSVLELPEHGQGRLSRLFTHIENCRVSIHDLSNVGTPSRFNMPFELGLTHAFKRYKKLHSIIILEKKRYRLDQTLSDLKGCDPLIHHGKAKGVIECILESLPPRGKNPELVEVYNIWRNLWKYARVLKRKQVNNTLYSRYIFKKLVSGALYYANLKDILKYI